MNDAGVTFTAPTRAPIFSADAHAQTIRMPSVPQLYDTQGKNRPRQSGGRALWTLFLGGVLALQLWSVGSLSSYALVLSDSYARHEELQTSLRDAELRLQSLQNATRDCESGQRDRADHAAAAERRLEDLQLRFDMLQDENTWLNQTAAAKEAALMNEQATRLSLEGSVQSLKEQMSLMQGQLVTAQQQQGTLHSGRHKHH